MSNHENIVTTCGREIGSHEIAHIQEVLGLCPGLSRMELALTLCEHWGWVSATGSLQRRACEKLLANLEREGVLRLRPRAPRGIARRRKQRVRASATERTTAPAPIAGDLAALRPIGLELVTDTEARGLWCEYVERYHALGCAQPFGCTLRYFISSARGRLGCMLISHAARALSVRDRWIGWSRTQRLQRLPWVINHSRQLLFPWVQVPHLASHVLGQLARRVAADWEGRWGYRPVLMETFVDPAFYRGVSYRAAGWELLGETSGRGLSRPGYHYRTTAKLIFVRPLVRDFRALLCSSVSGAGGDR